MNLRTAATLERLRQEEWFRNVGIRDTESAEILSSWEEALESCGSAEWEGLCEEAAHQYRERIKEKSLTGLAKWNDIVDSIKPVSQTLVREKTQRVIQDHNLPKAFLDTVDWDILHLCMEAELADIYPPGFYASQSYWYMKGHFPCGWKGPFPSGGKLIIY